MGRWRGCWDRLCKDRHMANLQVRNIPDELYERLREHAGKGNRTIRATVLAAVERELAWAEWERSLAEDPTTDLGIDAATLLAEARPARDCFLSYFNALDLVTL